MASNASSVIAATDWLGIVTRYANAEHAVTATQTEPSIDDCHAAKAIYLLRAPFALKGSDVASSSTSSGGIGAVTHVTLTNCITQKTVFDRTVDMQSVPPIGNGDLESSSDMTWDAEAIKSLKRNPLPLAGMTRIASVHPPLAYIVLDKNETPATSYRVFAHADGSAAPVAIFPVVESSRSTISLLLLESQPTPQAGDFVEPVDETVRSR